MKAMNQENIFKPYVAYIVMLALLTFGLAPMMVQQVKATNADLPDGWIIFGGDLQKAIQNCGPLPRRPISEVPGSEFYNPTQNSYNKKPDDIRVSDFVTLTCMWTGYGTGYQWKYMAEGSRYGFRAGKLISYEGHVDGDFHQCHNRVLVVIYQPKTEPEPRPESTPAKTPPPAATPQPTPASEPKPGPCIPSKMEKVFEHHSHKGFDPMVLIQEQLPNIEGLAENMNPSAYGPKVTSIFVYYNGCHAFVYVHSTITKSKLGWLVWMIPVAFLAGFLLGYYLRGRGREVKRVDAVKVQGPGRIPDRPVFFDFRT